MELPKISIITPSYNQGMYLRETIESIITQNYPNLEYIIVDGGSLDNSISIIKEYSSHISFWVSEPDDGQTDAINKGFRLATGDLLAWVNSDDLLMPNCLLEVGHCFNRSQPDLIHTNCFYICKNSKIIRAIKVPRQSDFFAFRGVWSTPQPAVFYKAKVLNEINFLDPKYYLSMDIDLWMRLIQRNINIVHIPQYLGCFRIHENSKTILSINKKRSKNDENPETKSILDHFLPNVSYRHRIFWRIIWRIYQSINLNYLLSMYDTHLFKDLKWHEIGIKNHCDESS